VSPFRPSFPPQPRVYSQPFDFVGPLFSYSYGLFVVPKTVNSFAIRQIRTLCAKYRGWGVSAASVPSVPARPEGGSPWQTPCSQQFAASLSSLCSLFGTPFLCFQQLAASFPKTPGVGVPLRHLSDLCVSALSVAFTFVRFSRRLLCPPLSTFRINTCKSVSKQMTLTIFRMNTYAKQGEGGYCACELPARKTQGRARTCRVS